MKLKLACVPIFAAACFLLYYGTGTLFLIPGDPGESYLKSVFTWRFLHGVVPTFSSAMLLCAVGWLWDRENGSPDVAKAIGWSFASAVAAIVLFWVALITWADLEHLQR